MFDVGKVTFFLLILFHSFSKLIQHISVILHRSRGVFFDVVSRFPSVFIFIITLPAYKVFLTILGCLVIYDPLDGVKGGFFVLWYVSLMLRIIRVVFEHVWGENWMTRIASGDVESEVVSHLTY